MRKIKWYDGSDFEVAGDCCLSIKGKVNLFFPNEKLQGDVWIESRDLQEIIDYARYIKDKDSTISVVCNSIWNNEERINLFLKHQELFDKVVLMPYVRGEKLNTDVYWKCFRQLTEHLKIIPKDKIIVDLVMATTISDETKKLSDFEQIIKVLHEEGYQTLISLDNYEFHSKDVHKDYNLQALSKLLNEKNVDYLLSLKK